jgi:hypothetical protein
MLVSGIDGQIPAGEQPGCCLVANGACSAGERALAAVYQHFRCYLEVAGRSGRGKKQ